MIDVANPLASEERDTAMHIIISLTISLILTTSFSGIAFSANQDHQKASKLIDGLSQINQLKMEACINDTAIPSASPTPPASSIFTDAYFKRSEKDGFSAEIDWKWISALGKLDPMMPKEGDDFYQMEVDLMKKSKSKKQMLMMRMGKCWFNMNGTYGLNETQDKIILKESSGFDLSYPDNCTFGTEGCVKINGRTHRVIAKNKVDPPVTQTTITTDYLKSIRESKQLIDEKCR